MQRIPGCFDSTPVGRDAFAVMPESGLALVQAAQKSMPAATATRSFSHRQAGRA